MRKLLVFTDLDGSLLCHRDYTWEKATPSLSALSDISWPLIINSSKTSAEIIKFNQLFNNTHPFVSENGSVVNIPKGYFSRDESEKNTRVEFETHFFAKPYKYIIDILNAIRQQYHLSFNGFNDMSVEEVASECSLGLQQASDAKQRQGTEPIIWLGSEDELILLTSLLAEKGLSIVKGGRFHHVMSLVNKGKALLWLKQKYKLHYPQVEWVTAALGDSFNDVPMLEVADIPVLIPNPEIKQPDLSHLSNLIIPQSPGPKGWNEAVMKLLDKNN